MASFKNLISTTSAQIASGGTITGDLVINGDLQVDGGGSLSFDEIVQGTQVIDVTNTEALLVRKNDDGGDVFVVDTTNSRVGIGVDSPTHNLNVYNGSGASNMTIGKYASGKTVALLATSADTSGYFQIQSYASQGTTFGNIALNAQGGNVGIGTDSPTRQLTLAGAGSAIKIDSSDNAYIELDRGASSDVGQLKFMTGGSAKWYAGMADSGSTGFDGTEFFIGEGSGGASDVHLVIDGSGNATFGGSVIIASGGSTDNLYLANTSYGMRITNSTGVIDFISNGSPRMSIANGGDVTVTSSLMINSSSANYADLTVGGTGDIVALRASSGTAGFTMYEAGTGRFNMTTLNGSNGIAFKTPSTTRMIIDDNSRISLSNNDSGTSNTVFGKLAGASIDAGSNYNTFIGENVADASLDDALYNSAVGYSTLSALTSGGRNTAMGSRALLQLTSGNYNTALGYYSGYGITTGVNNIHIGSLAGEGNTGASYLVGIGDDTFRVGGVTSGANGAVAVGYQALRKLTSGGSNTAVGYQAGLESTVGDFNTYIGYQSAYRTAGLDNQHNTFIGYGSGSGDWTSAKSDKNTGVGSLTLAGAMNSGIQNTALGFGALNIVTTGDSNVGVGVTAGNTLTSGSNNTIIGTDADTSASGSTNQIVIGATTTGVADNSVTLGNSSVTKLYIAPNSTDQQITFRENNQDQGIIRYLHSTEQMKFYVGGTEHSRLGAGGDLILLHGGVNFIDAEGTSASSDANTLDDYEEGTYTPVLSDGGTTFSCSTATGSYTKIGNQVFVQVTITTSENGSGSSLQISLPFNYNAGGSNFITASVRTGGIDLDGACVQVMLGNASGGTGNNLYFTEIRDNFSEATLAGTAMSSGDTIRFNAHYKVA